MKQILLFLLSSFIVIIKCQDEPGVIWMPSDHYYENRNGYQPKWLIIHGTAGGESAEAIGHWFQNVFNPASRVATHYIVGQDGKIVQSVEEVHAAWGNGRIEDGADSWWTPEINPNFETISIENVKPSTDNSDEITEPQMISLFYLVRNIIRRHPAIKIQWADSTGGITGHFSVSPLSRARCPGPMLWKELFAYLKNEEIEPSCIGIIGSSGGSNVNVHVLPNATSPVQGVESPGNTVPIHRRVLGGNGENDAWFHVWNGYINAENVLFNEPEERPEWCFK